MKILRDKLFATVPQPGQAIDPEGQQEMAEQTSKDQTALDQMQNQAIAQNQRAQKITVEQMRNQRQQLQIQNSRRIMNNKLELQKARQLMQLRRMQQEKDEIDSKNQIRAAKFERDSEVNPAVRNANLYKSRSKILPTVGMPR